jgi:molybdopterin molybdotransferase
MLSVKDACERLSAALAPGGHEVVPLPDAWNRVLATPVTARLTQPPADVSAMDGYAVRASDATAGAKLLVIGEAPAGHPFDGTIGPGQTVRIFTGSVVPAGADAVLLQEDSTPENASPGSHITVNETVPSGRHIRPRGQDFETGAIVLHEGQRLSARQIGLAAAANHAWLSVHRRPRVAILATGDEIFSPGDTIPPGGIVSSNSHMLAAMIRAEGGDPTILPVARDTPDAIADAAASVRHADLLVTTGGASVGTHDVVQAGLQRHGFALDFWRIAMRPGKPMIFGRIEHLPVLGLPGNPVSAYVCAVLFLLPALRRLQGLPAAAAPTMSAIARAPLRANDHRADHLRATLSRTSDGTLVATPFPRQDSAMLSLLTQADCLLLRPPHAPAAARGDVVEIISLRAGSDNVPFPA